MSVWYHLNRILFLRCDGASELTSEALDEPLVLPARLALYGHLLGCHSCRRFARQLRVLRAAYRHRGAARPEDGPWAGALWPEARSRIAAALRAADGTDLTDRSRPGQPDPD